MKIVYKNKIVFFIAICTLFGLAHAALSFDAKKSSVVITAKQMNVPLTAKFTKINGTVNYDPAKPDATTAKIEIDINSFDLGDPEYNKDVLSKDWFNAAQFPKATFVSTSMKAAGEGKLTANGKLTIKGKTADVSFPVSIKKDGNATLFDGSLPIRRLTFNVGEGDWKDTSMVADEVVIKFHVVVQ